MAASILTALPAAADVDIRVHSATRIDVRAERAPLAEVLDALAKKTGMTVVYATERPEALVAVDLKGVTLRQAVTELLRDRGLGYAFTARAGGNVVERLVITRGGEAAAGGAVSTPPPDSPDEVVPHPEYYEETIVETPQPRRTGTATPTAPPPPR